MQRIVIFGNSGSGKSTLAKDYKNKCGLSHLDLDVLAWRDTNPPMRKPLKDSFTQINKFLEKNQEWIIEGCYSDLLEFVIKESNEMIFLNPGIETCINNCKSRAWEPHKYKSMEEQNKNLDMLLNWLKQYPVRDDKFSLTAHRKIFNEFVGKKTEYKSNQRDT